MTPRGPDKQLQPSTLTNYNIDDFCSDDSTDDEDRPKKQVPRWAKGKENYGISTTLQKDFSIQGIPRIVINIQDKYLVHSFIWFTTFLLQTALKINYLILVYTQAN